MWPKAKADWLIVVALKASSMTVSNLSSSSLGKGALHIPYHNMRCHASYFTPLL